MEKFETLISRAVCLPRNDVDTDQIIPARFLRTTERTGLGKHLFQDWRYDSAAQPRAEFVLNKPEHADAQVLVAGRNFGCGSSREHAVWAILDHGIRAVISPSFADIFMKNSLRNGLLPVTVDDATYEECLRVAETRVQFTIDLEAQQVTASEDLAFSFEIDPFARTCLLQGIDDLEYILKHEDRIAAFEARTS